jgi:AAA domain
MRSADLAKEAEIQRELPKPEVQKGKEPRPQGPRIWSLPELRNRPLPAALVSGLIAEHSLSGIIAKSGSGKTFIAIDLALSIATNIPWHSRPVKQGTVVYVTAEGSLQLLKRIEAWKQQHAVIEDPPLFIVDEAVNLTKAGDVDWLCAAIEPKLPILIVIDPLANFMPGGDQNDASAIGTVNAVGFTKLRERTGAAILVVMHAGWSGNRERGSSALRDITDTSILIKVSTRDSVAGVKTLMLSELKQRDLDSFDPIQLELRRVTVDVDGQRVSTCTISDPARLRPASRRKDLAPSGKTVFKALVAAGRAGLRYTEWLKASKISDSTLRRARLDLTERGRIWYDEDTRRYHVTEESTVSEQPKHRHDDWVHNSQPAQSPRRLYDGGDCGDCAGNPGVKPCIIDDCAAKSRPMELEAA